MNMLLFMEKIGLDKDCIKQTTDLYNQIKFDKEIVDIISIIENHGPIDKVHSGIEKYAEKNGLNNKEINLAVVCATWYVFKKNYEEKGISEALFWNCMKDIKYQAEDCKNFHGVWGIISMYWYDGYYKANRYDLGRLQFEKVPFDFDVCTIKGTTVHNGDTVINIHIPSSGPLYPQEVEASLKTAYEFFENSTGKLIFICKSWLLYPSYQCVFPKKSNIYKFREFFEIFETVEHENFSSGCIRVFFKDVTSDIDQLPQNTSLQKAFVEYMKKENSTYGLGCGMIIIDNGKRL